MTPAERALLLAVAKYVHLHIRDCGLSQRTALFQAIAAVEAEAAPEATSKSCENCDFSDGPCFRGDPTWNRRCDEWQPKPNVCPTCEGEGGKWVSDREFWDCPDCGGTGEEKTNE